MRRTDNIARILLIAATIAVIWWSKYPHVLLNAPSSLAHCNGIDSTVAQSLRRHWWLFAHLFTAIYSHFPPSLTTFARIETLAFLVPLVWYIQLMYGLCRRFAGPLASLATCLYLLVIYQTCWYDNFMSPGDPWGSLLSVFILEGILDNDPMKYGISMLFSGMIWEKAYLVPFSQILADLLDRRRGFEKWGWFLLGVTTVGWAVLAWTLIMPLDQWGWGNCTTADFLRRSGSYWGAWAIMFGPPVAAIALNWKRTPTIFRAMLIQFPVWVVIYWRLGGCTSEMRQIIIMATFVYPMLAMSLDISTEPTSPKRTRSRQPNPGWLLTKPSPGHRRKLLAHPGWKFNQSMQRFERIRTREGKWRTK